MTTDPKPPSLPRRAVRKLMLILLARLPTGRWLAKLPGFRRHYVGRILARRDHTGLHTGVYDSYEAALADIPPSRLAGWDHAEASTLWLGQIDPVQLSTYPVLFWIAQALRENEQLVDYCGSIGLTYYGFRRYAPLPRGAGWTVVEVPQIARQGRLVAQREQATALQFRESLAEAPACDVLISCGAMQYMPQSVPGLLEALPARPRLVVLNKLPVTPAADAWTLQNYGPAVAPMRLFNREAFLGYFTQAGYRLVDEWTVDNLDCLIPFHPERALKTFSGFVLERID